MIISKTIRFIKNKFETSRFARLAFIVWVIGIAAYALMAVIALGDFIDGGLTIQEYVDGSMSTIAFLGLHLIFHSIVLLAWTVVVAFVAWGVDWVRSPTKK